MTLKNDPLLIHRKRIKIIQLRLKTYNLDAVFITNQSNIFYLSGITPFHDTKELTAVVMKNQFLILSRSTYATQAKKQKITGKLLEITSTQKVSYHLRKILYQQKRLTVGFEPHNLTVKTLHSLQKKTPNIHWKKTERMIEQERQIKDDFEISSLQKAANITDQAFSFILKKIKPGQREKDIALELEIYLRKHADGIAFRPIVASGKNSASPHYIPGEKKIEKGEMVLLDFGAKVDGYCADLSRMIFIGKATKKFRKVYDTVLTAQKKTIEVLKRQINPENDRLKLHRKTISCHRIDAIARDYIRNAGYPNTPHGIGHCLGIDIHESPSIVPNTKDIIQPGMVFTIEPGIYLPGWGGVRLEDLVAWIPKEGIKILSRSPKKLIQL